MLELAEELVIEGAVLLHDSDTFVVGGGWSTSKRDERFIVEKPAWYRTILIRMNNCDASIHSTPYCSICAYHVLVCAYHVLTSLRKVALPPRPRSTRND